MSRRQEHISLGERSYTVTIDAGLPPAAVPLIQERFSPGPITIITDDNVGPLYLAPLEQAFLDSGWTVEAITVPAGEPSKSLPLASRILEQIIESRPDRTRPILGLGGGVVGDLAGFVASVYMRGVPAIHIATSLLSQVDSSVGGKTGLNHGNAKNLVGTFHQPALVFCALGCLKTLEPRQILSGMAEMVKAGLLRSPHLLEEMKEHSMGLRQADADAFLPLVSEAVAIKARIVEEDEQESGVRALLNLGHTYGHALESAMGLGEWTHGEAVAVGMVAAAHVSVMAEVAPSTLPSEIESLLRTLGLPTETKEYSGWRKAITKDKKSRGKDVLFVALKAAGEPILTRLPLEKVIFWIETRMFGYPSGQEGVHHD